MRLAIGWVLIGILCGCASRPTVIRDNVERRMQALDSAGGEKIELSPQTVVLDARPAFEYSTGHIPGSFNLAWDAFSQAEENQRGLLQADLYEVARRLARLGISPETPVVVVGNGLEGQGEEGRLAWMLLYLGVEKVRFANLRYFTGHLTIQEPAPPRNAPIWKPLVRESLFISKKDFRQVVNEQKVHSGTHVILDVRTSREYLGKEGWSLTHSVPNLDAINIPWKEFFTEDGRPQLKMRRKLIDHGITLDKQVIVMDDRGVRSGAVTAALLDMGYTNVSHMAGGLLDLLAP